MRLRKSGRASRLVGIVAGVLSLGLLASACGGGGTGAGAADGGAEAGAAGGKGTITIGYITWAEDIAATYLWEHMLEERGYNVKLTQAAVGAVFRGVSSGDLQLFFDMWLPVTHKQYKQQYGDQIEKLSLWYDNATLEIAVPEYVDLDPTGPDEIGDLRGKAEMFDGKIVGIEPGAGLTDITKSQVIPMYNLKDYTLATSSTSAMLAALESATEAKEPIVVTLWHPHWAYDAYPIKDLRDPKGALGGAEKIYAVAHKGFSEKYPQVAEWISGFAMSDKELASLENLVVNQAESPEGRRQAVDEWVSNHKKLVTKWAGPVTS